MTWREKSIATAALLVMASTLLAGCGQELSPEEEIAAIRSQYSAELKSLTVKQDPTGDASDEGGEATDEAMAADEPTEAEEDAGAEGAAEEEAVAEEPETAIEAPNVKTDVILDILVSTTSDEYLPGVTIDVLQVDSEEREKDHRRLWVDTTEVLRGPGTQVTRVLEDVDYQPGDGFYVEVRSPIPPDQRAEYREFELQ